MTTRSVFVLLLLCAMLCVNCASEDGDKTAPDEGEAAKPTAAEATQPSAYTEQGQASYYGEAMDGAQTASGDTYRNDALTGAHRTLEFGTKVRVTNLDNGKSVEVLINDRGPTAKGVIIDVSYSAAQALDMLDAGIVNARIEVVE
jgi:rare lipoprotein A